MKVEFLIVGNEYKKIIKEHKPLDSLKVYQPRKRNAEDYILTISCKGESAEIAKTLSDYIDFLLDEFQKNEIKYYVMINQTSDYYLQMLYPLVCEFETKLRKFITWSFIDLTETVSRPISNYFCLIQDFDSQKNVFNSNTFLESWTLGQTFEFLFSKIDVEKLLNIKINEYKKYNKTINKNQIIDILNSIEEHSVWDEFFAENYKDNELPLIYQEIFNARNHVMHFKATNNKKFLKMKKIIERGIKSLNNILEHTVQIESTDSSLAALINKTDYFTTVLNAFTNKIIEHSKSEVFKNYSTMFFQSLNDNIYTTLAANGSIVDYFIEMTKKNKYLKLIEISDTIQTYNKNATVFLTELYPYFKKENESNLLEDDTEQINDNSVNS